MLTPAVISRSRADGHGVVGGWERGQASVEYRFDSEDAACRYLYRVLAGHP